jgi:hypothetical protein
MSSMKIAWQSGRILSDMDASHAVDVGAVRQA